MPTSLTTCSNAAASSPLPTRTELASRTASPTDAATHARACAASTATAVRLIAAALALLSCSLLSCSTTVDTVSNRTPAASDTLTVAIAAALSSAAAISRCHDRLISISIRG